MFPGRLVLITGCNERDKVQDLRHDGASEIRDGEKGVFLFGGISSFQKIANERRVRPIAKADAGRGKREVWKVSRRLAAFILSISYEVTPTNGKKKSSILLFIFSASLFSSDSPKNGKPFRFFSLVSLFSLFSSSLVFGRKKENREDRPKIEKIKKIIFTEVKQILDSGV